MTIKIETRGIIYTATGPKQHLTRAVVSYLSAHHYAPHLPGTVFTNHAGEDPLICKEATGKCSLGMRTHNVRQVFTQVTPCKCHKVDHSQYMLDRLTNLLATPYDRTLAMDTDTYFLEDPSSIFDVLDNFDVVMCHGHNRERRHAKAEASGKSGGVPQAFAPVQGGLIAYRMSGVVESYLQALLALYREKQYFDDQISMRQLLFERRDVRLYILPYEYNFNCSLDIKRWRDRDHREAIPRIFHYTAHKGNFREVVKNYDPIKVVS